MAVKRFYETFHPDHYDLFIDVNRKDKKITGTSTIHGEALSQTVLISQKYLTVSQVTANGQAVDFKVNDQDEAIEINLAETGEVVLAIDYQAPLTDTMMGIYPSYYMLDGEKKQLVGTQFETTAARQAFPCVDEPEAKATFSLALKFDEQPGEIALANMPEVKVENGVHYFQETVRMSSYLVAFAFGEMRHVETKTKSGVLIGVYSTKAHQEKELTFSLDIAKRAIEFYEDFYQTPYPLPQSLQLALPDFSAGAMENWGLVTYREAYLTLDPDNTTLEMKKLVATVIAHELAHQWFGDLVTMKWWDNLWLNESFANMMEYLSVDHLEPDWHIWEMFQTSEAASALTRDATDGVQSVHVEVNDPAEIDTLFDGAIVYAKGSRMLVMVRSLLGDEALRKGLKKYFDEHKFGNAEGDDLWDALSSATDLNIGEIMHTWLDQPGYPVVNAQVNAAGHLVLSQKQFFIGEGEDKQRKWEIPLNANFAAPQIMSDFELDLGDYKQLRAQAGQALRLNVGNSSHFIVKYDETLMKDILAGADELDPISKLQLLQDLRFLAEGGQASYAEIVPLLVRFKDDKSNLVSDALYTTAAKLRQFVTPDSSEEKNLKQLYQQLSANQFDRLGLTSKSSDNGEDVQMRATIASAALYGENEAAKSAAHELFTANKDNLFALEADTRASVIANEVKNYLTDGLVDQLIKEYQTTSDPSYKIDLRLAIVSVQAEDELAKIVGYFKDADVVKPQDLRGWFAGVLSNKHGQKLAWQWIQDDWAWLEKTVGGDMEFATFITVIARIFHTQERLDEFKAFFEPKINVPGLTREIQMDVKVIETRVNLIANEQAAVNKAIAAEL